MAPLRLTFEQGTSSKFWEIELDGAEYTVWWGRIGTAGQSKTKTFPTEEKAAAAAEKLIAEKRGKGYVDDGSEPVERTDAPARSAPKRTPDESPASIARPAPSLRTRPTTSASLS